MLEQLRKRHPRFVYRHYEVAHTGDDVRFSFEFVIEPDIVFRPEVVIADVDAAMWDACPPALRDNLAFHLGLAEIPSYWKAACSPEIVIEAGSLDTDQLAWWHDLLINGMGEFFFVNQSDFTAPDFVRLRAQDERRKTKDESLKIEHALSRLPSPVSRIPHPASLVPIGGGKDSAVTLEIARQHEPELGCMLLNPTQAARDIVRAAGCEHVVLIKRTIDPTLLRLNSAGYLNGHTPFSSYLAFLSVTCAALFGYRRVAVSNERSSNEGNALFHGREVNHQYSKTFDFEQKFRTYAETYLATGVDFFSFMRPLYELQIAQLFARMPAYHTVFRSCNRGQRTNEWCCNCPKCLFAYAILFPFLPAVEMERIFAQDLFARADMLPLALELLGAASNKPFECVGTHEENIAAFHLSRQKLVAAGQPLPPLLALVEERVLRHQANLDARAAAVLGAWNAEHALPATWEAWLHTAVAPQA